MTKVGQGAGPLPDGPSLTALAQRVEPLHDRLASGARTKCSGTPVAPASDTGRIVVELRVCAAGAGG